jgi:hypothetical protein
MSEMGYAVESDARQMAVPNKKVKKPGFFKRWLLKSVKEAVEDERRGVNLVGAAPDIISSKSLRLGSQPASIDQPERAIHFTVYVANGGRIVETRRVDRKTDRTTNGLYIITNDQEFGKEIDKIITMEALK